MSIGGSGVRASDSWAGENAFVSEVLHDLSQPLTALECGLELSLRQDKTVAELRNRMETLLEAAQLLRRRVLELRALQDAADAGNTSAPVAVNVLLENLQDDLSPVTELSKIGLVVKCRPARAYGNAERLRNGFFHLLEFLLRRCPGGSVTLAGRRSSAATMEFAFRASSGHGGCTVESVAAPSDLDWRIAERTFVAAGGRMDLLPAETGAVAGVVTLRAVAEGDEQ